MTAVATARVGVSGPPYRTAVPEGLATDRRRDVVSDRRRMAACLRVAAVLAGHARCSDNPVLAAVLEHRAGHLREAAERLRCAL